MYGDIFKDASKITDSLTGFNPGGQVTPSKSTSPSTGVVKVPLDPYQARMQYLRDSGRGGGGLSGGFGASLQKPGVPDAVTTSINDQISKYGTMYGDLVKRLQEFTAGERQNITNASSRAATYMGEIDPMAGYRPTFTALQAPQAAASTYLGAIGADPAQVQAQQALANQLMASQAGDQSQFAQAVDAAQRNYRLNQLAEVYANQARAESALGAATSAQQTQIGLKQMEEENALRKMLLEYQMQLAVEAMRNR